MADSLCSSCATRVLKAASACRNSASCSSGENGFEGFGRGNFVSSIAPRYILIQYLAKFGDNADHRAA